MDFGLPKTYSRVTGAAAIRTAWESPEKNLPEAKVWRMAEASLRPQTSPLQRRPAGKADGFGRICLPVAADRAFPAAVAIPGHFHALGPIRY